MRTSWWLCGAAGAAPRELRERLVVQLHEIGVIVQAALSTTSSSSKNDRNRLSRAVLITGAASGIGRGIARALAGHRLFLLDVDREGLEATAAEVGASPTLLVADLRLAKLKRRYDPGNLFRHTKDVLDSRAA